MLLSLTKKSVIILNFKYINLKNWKAKILILYLLKSNHYLKLLNNSASSNP